MALNENSISGFSLQEIANNVIIPNIIFFINVCFCLLLTVWRLAKVAIFTTNVDAENQTLINH
jgi:uncharacterized membrane protein